MPENLDYDTTIPEPEPLDWPAIDAFLSHQREQLDQANKEFLRYETQRPELLESIAEAIDSMDPELGQRFKNPTLLFSDDTRTTAFSAALHQAVNDAPDNRAIIDQANVAADLLIDKLFNTAGLKGSYEPESHHRRALADHFKDRLATDLMVSEDPATDAKEVSETLQCAVAYAAKDQPANDMDRLAELLTLVTPLRSLEPVAYVSSQLVETSFDIAHGLLKYPISPLNPRDTEAEEVADIVKSAITAGVAGQLKAEAVFETTDPQAIRDNLDAACAKYADLGPKWTQAIDELLVLPPEELADRAAAELPMAENPNTYLNPALRRATEDNIADLGYIRASLADADPNEYPAYYDRRKQDYDFRIRCLLALRVADQATSG